MGAGMSTTHDALVIGAGQSGGPLSTALAEAGRRTAIVERAHVGGTCINEGCTPTKTMIASGRVAHLARRGADYGVLTGPVSVDMAKVRQRKREIVSSWSAGSQKRIEGTANCELVWGEARFTGPREVEVALNAGGTRRLSAPLVFVNVGARPARPDIPGLDTVPYLDSTSVMELGEVPEHLVVVGGGYIGLEFGQLFRRLGSRVTIVQRGGRLLAREDDDVADAVRAILEEDGIEVLFDAAVTAVATLPTAAGSGGGDGVDGVRVDVAVGGGQRSLEGSHLLVAVGRTPNTDQLDCAAAGIELDAHGYVKVDSRLRTNVEGVYALGDCHGGPAFTHISYDDWRLLRTNLLEGGDATTEGRMVPYVVYIDPQLGRVGVGEREARERGLDVRVAKMPMSHVARALETDEPRGLMKVVVDRASERILGCAILGIEGGEIMSMLQVAMMGGVRHPALREAVFAHPTLAESLNNLFGAFTD
ncbi:MAG TPA: mercuric reductase [Candidatus Dormibacteraeota bacterium]|jgi:pyruvate/2-oxoglutarate dehydrogenase complex dihydrolipoamide dehydrogenase (E3) component|nr:mercuric reductase [Candidatus Dormibacteraeota bacterium]